MTEKGTEMKTKMRKLLALIMVLSMLFCTTTIGASADSEGELLDSEVEKEGSQVDEGVVSEPGDSEEEAEVGDEPMSDAARESVTENTAQSLESEKNEQEDSDASQTDLLVIPEDEEPTEGYAGDGTVNSENANTNEIPGKDLLLDLPIVEDADLIVDGTEESTTTTEEEAQEESETTLVSSPNGPSLDSCDVLVSGIQYYSLAFEVLELVNEVRISKGLNALTMDAAALEHAMNRACQISLYCAHGQPNGASHGYGCSTRISGENIAFGYSTPAAAVEGWINSVGHYSVMTDNDYLSTGVGVFKIGEVYFWVQVFSGEDGVEVSSSSYSDSTIQAAVNIADYRIEGKITPKLLDHYLEVGETTSFEVWFQDTDEGLGPNIPYELPAEGLIYTNTDDSVCTVSESGVVTAIGLGTTTITATYPDYDLTPWTFEVTVCNHSYISAVTTEATCTKKGVRTYTCESCGDSYTEDISAFGHTWINGEVIEEPTCVDYGTRAISCETCGEDSTDIIVPTLIHTYDDGVTTREPTCGASGVITYTCKICGNEKIGGISPTGKHDWDDGVVTIEPGCGTYGQTTYTCTVCEQTTADYIQPTGDHTLDDGVVTIEPGCVTYGRRLYRCLYCTYTYEEGLKPLGHSYDEGTVTTKPGCSTPGEMLYACKDCEHTKTETILPTNHNWGDGLITTKPGCSTTGVRTYTCTKCGGTRTATIKATGHDYSVITVLKEPTCTDTGRNKEKCANCTSFVYTTPAALGHNEVTDEYVAPTCEETGLTEGSHCDRCKKVFVKQETIDATGHSYDDGTITKYPTVKATGVKTYYCTNGTCTSTESETLAKLEGALLGDVNGDGKVNIIDYSYIKRVTARWDIEYSLSGADINCNGTITIIDASLLKRYIMKWDMSAYGIGTWVGDPPA